MAKRSKIAMQGLSERIVDMWDKEKMTLTDIANVLLDEGWDVSRTGVYREVNKWKDFLDDQKEQDKFAQQFLDEFKDRPNTDISELSLQIMQRKIFGALQELDVDTKSFKDVSQLVGAIARLSDSQVNLDRLKTEFQKGVKAAKELFEDELRDVLEEQHPELLIKLIDIIQSVRIDSDGRKRKKKRRG
ncbi:phage protein Gp27 family protein [Vibrio mimicus]